MQTHRDFIFHLDEPREQFEAGRRKLRGWITAQDSLGEIRLRGEIERLLQKEERSDVRLAFPNFSCASGFVGEVTAGDLHHGELRFSFSVGGAERIVMETLSPAPSPPPWFSRKLARLRRSLALRRLRFAHDADARWKTALAALLLEIKIARGESFRREEADRVIALFVEIFPEAFVVQIGANDGSAGDPLVAAFEKTRWSGLLVEPVPHLYEALVARYRDRPNISVARAAISTRDGEALLYRLREIPGETPQWFSQLATLDRNVLLKHRDSIPNIESLIVEERTPTVRLGTLFEKHDVKRIDFLVIDTEGHDYEILRDFDFARFHPTLLMFEHQHLTAHDKAAAYALLKARGYTCKETPEGDAIAWRIS
ncbi:MAG: FkbM family methyltransferase [Chthoniobacterales bacterium]